MRGMVMRDGTRRRFVRELYAECEMGGRWEWVVGMGQAGGTGAEVCERPALELTRT